jgi:tripartite-type tricarboxylate transporter receptor subunit TctC
MRRWLCAGFVIAAAICGGALSASAQNADADFFKGKTITYIVAVGPGGGYDAYARLLTRHLSKYLPETRIVVRNVPGAGHIVGTNTIYAARPDGLTIGTFSTGLVYSQLLEREGVRFDLADMSWIGRMAEEARGLVLSSNSDLRDAEALLHADGPILFATSGIGASNHMETRMLAYALGLDVMLVPNMENGETQMSMVRGEISAVLASESSYDTFIEQGNGRFVLAFAGSDTMFPGTPQARDFIVREDARPLFDLIETISGLGRLTAGPPGMAPGRLSVLRAAFDSALSDPQLISEAEQLVLPINPGTGAEVAQKMRQALDQAPGTVALLKQIVDE